jgi:hypothetical protein
MAAVVFKHLAAQLKSTRDDGYRQSNEKADEDQTTDQVSPHVYRLIVAGEEAAGCRAARAVVDSVAMFDEFVVLDVIRRLCLRADERVTYFIHCF